MPKSATLYRYDQAELTELKQAVQAIEANAKEVAVVFNNNAGRDAADNARALIDALQIDYEALNPNQLKLF